MVLPVEFQRERKGLREWLPLLRGEVLLERVADGLDERRPNGRQVSQHFSIQLLHVESYCFGRP